MAAGAPSDVPFVQIEVDRSGAAPAEKPPPGGYASTIAPVLGGETAIAVAHTRTSAEERMKRREEIQHILSLYVDGEPKEPAEFEMYEALKDESNWLEQHPK